MITLALSSLAMLAITAVYLAALHFFQALSIEKSQVAPLVAMEEVTRTVTKASGLSVSSSGDTLTLTVGQETIQYQFQSISGGSYELHTIKGGGDIGEVEPGLLFKYSNTNQYSFFSLVNPTTVKIKFVVSQGMPPTDRTLETSVAARAMSSS